MMGETLDTVVVIGAGIAGLLAADAAARFSKRVVVFDVDHLPEGTGPRAYVPQSGQAHTLLARGLESLERRFPDFRAILLERGASEFEWLLNTWGTSHGGYKLRIPSGLRGLAASRPLLEAVICEAVKRRGNVELLERHRVLGLIATGKIRVCGVEVEHDGERFTVPADLVVDASGRSSHLMRWLEGLSIPRPPVLSDDPDLGYATQWLAVDGSYRRRFQIVSNFDMNGAGSRTAGLFFIEDGKALLIATGASGDYPPKDQAKLLDFIRQVPMTGDWLPEILAASRPISEVYLSRSTTNRWVRYDQGPMPDGVVAFGDSVCVFNPVYGQGMTLAAMGADVLEYALQCSGRALNSLSFQKAIARTLRGPWRLSTSSGVLYKHNRGERLGVYERLTYWFFDGLLRATNRHPGVIRRFVRVMHMLSPVESLLEPRTLLSVCSNQGRQTTSRPPREKGFSKVP